ncbi:MAG: NAD+ synthase [Candidatus Thorarchaeota archaeon]
MSADDPMKFAMAQINPTVGDLKGNSVLISETIRLAKQSGACLVMFPELSVTGYPPQDLLYQHDFVNMNIDYVRRICAVEPDMTVVVGFVDRDHQWNLYNAAAIISHGQIVDIVRKTLLPTYDVFDEARYFAPQRPDQIRPVNVTLEGRTVMLGVEICEDLWDTSYDTKVTDILSRRGAQLVLNISASPFHVGKGRERLDLLASKARSNGVPMLLVNMVGGQDELVFDGQSIAVDASGECIAYGKAFEEEIVYVDIDPLTMTAAKVIPPSPAAVVEVYHALVLGVRDYFRKTGFKRAVLGLSGGIDSSVSVCIAADALGPENVIGVSMPSRFSSEHSKRDAAAIAENLGICYLTQPIQGIVESYHRELETTLTEIRTVFKVDAREEDPVADENIQPRVRGNCLMDISNRFKSLRIMVLNTGNKTELALGFCTLYGDLTGGLGVLGDVSKLMVYELGRYINTRAGREIIPQSVFEKRPSPELKENQFDPFDFDIVSPLVDEIVENRRGRAELIAMGYPPDVVDDTLTRIRRAEYKRWQAPPCIKITRRAFGTGWKMPIVNHYAG